MPEGQPYSSRSKTTAAASFSIVTLVSYLALVHLKEILMPLAIAILIYFLIRAPENYLLEKIEIVRKFPLLAYAIILSMGSFVAYLISILLYNNLSDFIDETNKEGGLIDQFDEKWDNLANSELYGLEKIFQDNRIEDLLNPENIEAFATGILADAAQFMTTLVTVAIFVVFIILEEKSIPGRFKAAFPDSYQRVEKILSDSYQFIRERRTK